jgi:hypothetical protein
MHMHPFGLIFKFLLIISISISVITESISQPIGKDITGAEFIKLLEQKHQTDIFFREEWLGESKFSSLLLEESLPVVLEHIAKVHNLRIVTLRGLIFLIPAQNHRSAASDSGGMMVVGNPNEFGRFSKVTISGKITDGATGEPLFGAVVMEPESRKGASTNMQGIFSIEVPAGEIKLKLSYIGYEEKMQLLRVYGAGNVEFELFAGSTQLDGVTVMARRAGENLVSARMGIVHLDAKTIKELPVNFGEKDIVRSISLMPGVQTIGEFGAGFHVRGSSSDQNLILIENVPLFNSSHLFGLISVINPDLLSSASLIKSGMPAKYGERAASVLDIKLGNGHNVKESKVMGGIGILNSRLLIETPLVKEKASLAFGGRFSNPAFFLKKIPSEDLYNSSAGFYDFNALSQISFGRKTRLVMFGYHTGDNFSFKGETNYRYASTLGSIRLNHIFGQRLSTAFILGFSNYEFETREEPELNPTLHFKLNSALSYQTAKWSFNFLPTANHNIEWGLNAVKYKIEPGYMAPQGKYSVIKSDNMKSEQALEISAYVSDDISLGEKVSMEIGLRFNQYLQLGAGTVYLYEDGLPRSNDFVIDSLVYGQNDIISDYSALEPRIGFRLKTGEFSSFKLSYARVHQYISLISNTSIMGPADLWKLSDTYLKPLQSDQFALGFYQNFRNNTIEFSAETYYKLLQNAYEYKSGADIAMNRYIETDMVNVTGVNYGLEFLLLKPAGRFSGWTSYTYSVSKMRSNSPYPDSQINRNNYFPSNYDRPHNLVVNSTMNLSRRWRFGGTFTYTTGRPVTLPELSYQYEGNYLIYFSDRNKYRLPDYHRLDLSISLNENLRLTGRGKRSFTFSVMNVYGRKNPHSVFYKRNPAGMWGVQNFKLYQLFIISRPIPTFTLNFTF